MRTPRTAFRSTLRGHLHAALLATLLACMPWTQTAGAFDIVGVQNAALDLPRINALFRRTPDGAPLTGIDPLFGDEIFNVQAFFDTGASGVILSEDTADFLGVQRAPGVVFEDVGVGGSAPFGVSEPLFVHLAPFTPAADINNPASAAAVYTQHFGPLRTQIGPLGGVSNPLLGAVDVLGVPAMQGKVVVMDPAPLDTLSGTMNTYVYDPGTPFKPATADSDPGIPGTDRTIALSFSSFDRFTRLTPPAAAPPTLRPNPFIGPDPLATGDDTPGITLSLGEQQTTGSFLLDTGAAASAISLEQAANLHVRYRAGAAEPTLEAFDPADPAAPGTVLPDQFIVTLGGIGGQQTAAGFFLDSMLVRTQQGDASDDDDPAHLRYVRAPVLVADIALEDAATGEVVKLDGLFGMNFLVASIFFSEPLTLGDIGASPFRWVVFDHANGVLGVTLVPEPGTVALVVLGLGAVALRLRRMRAAQGSTPPSA